MIMTSTVPHLLTLLCCVGRGVAWRGPGRRSSCACTCSTCPSSSSSSPDLLAARTHARTYTGSANITEQRGWSWSGGGRGHGHGHGDGGHPRFVRNWILSTRRRCRHSSLDRHSTRPLDRRPDDSCHFFSFLARCGAARCGQPDLFSIWSGSSSLSVSVFVAALCFASPALCFCFVLVLQQSRHKNKLHKKAAWIDKST